MTPGSFHISLKVFLVHDGKLLVLRDRAAQHGDLPGGRLATTEFHGDWQQALERELREELGDDVRYQIDPEPLFIFPHVVVSTGDDALGVVYHAEFLGGTLHLSDEHDHFEWVVLRTYDPDGFFSKPYAAAIRRYRKRFVGVP